jgi:hypothetical protein
MRAFLFIKVFLILVFTVAFAGEIPARSCPEIINYIEENLAHHGTLRKSGGFVYLDLDDEYVHQLITFIENDGFEEPPYFGEEGLVGAHITVMSASETKKYGISEIKECGEEIYFVPKKCQVVNPFGWDRMEEVYFIVVEASRLDAIREEYGLPKSEHDFHITIGVKPKIAQSA